MKIHIQGEELKLLSGARKSLSSASICVLLFKAYSIQMADGDPVDIAAEFSHHLSNYTVVVVDMDGNGSPLGSGASLVKAFEDARQAGPLGYSNNTADFNHMLVAWHRGQACRTSPAVEV